MMLSILHAPTEMIHPDLLNIMDESDVDSVAPGDTIQLQDQEHDTSQSINHNEKLSTPAHPHELVAGGRGLEYHERIKHAT